MSLFALSNLRVSKLLKQALDLFPQVVSFTIRGQAWVLAEYKMWKAKVLQFQAQVSGGEQ